MTELEAVKQEREDLQTRYHLLASEMVYEGNSVQHWRQKALAYKECAGAIYDLKQIMGVNSPAETAGAVKSLAAHVERIAAYKDRLEAKKLMPARLAGIIEEHPTTSLARLKAEWQAEILQYLERKAADHRDPSYPVVPLTEVQRLLAEKLSQAEECPGHGKCDDPGCPAHYAAGDE